MLPDPGPEPARTPRWVRAALCRAATLAGWSDGRGDAVEGAVRGRLARPRGGPPEHASTPSSPRTWPAAATARRTRSRLPLHLLLPASGPAAALAPGLRRRRWRTPRSVRAGRGTPSPARPPRCRPPILAPEAVGRVDVGAPVGHRGTAGQLRLLRPARVGDGAPARRGHHPAPRLAAPPRSGRHRPGRRVAPGRLLALRRVPLLHPVGPAAQRAPARSRRPGGVRAAGAACTPTWTSTSTPSG